MPAIPLHLDRARTDYPGPVTGNYISITFGGFVRSSGLADQVAGGIILPFSMRLMRVAWSVLSGGITVHASFSLHQHASAFTVAGSTDILSADVDIDGDPSGLAYATGTTPTLAVRNLERGERIFVALTSDGTGAYTNPLTDSLHGFVTGVVNVHEGND